MTRCSYASLVVGLVAAAGCHAQAVRADAPATAQHRPQQTEIARAKPAAETAMLERNTADQAGAPPTGGTPATPPVPAAAGNSARRPWTEPHPEIPYLPKSAARPADWLVEHPPVDPDASPEAKALLHFLYSISGKHTLTGQHNYAAQQEYSTDLATRVSGKTPTIYGTDWGFAAAGDKDSAYVRHETVQELVRQWRRGQVIALCWHAARPIEDEPVTFRGNVQGHITGEQFHDLLTPGTDVYKHWCVQVDAIAEYLKQLQEAHVPVLWRPYHEINGDWFWWNGIRGDAAQGTKQLYRQLYDRLVHFHHLNNLVWVWNPDRPARADRQFVDYFPGPDYVDVLALDCYGTFEQSFYDDLNALSGGKVLAIGETSRPPSPDVYKTQPKWAYYMLWAVDRPASGAVPTPGRSLGGPDIRAIVNDPRMLSLQDPAYWPGINAIRTVAGLTPIKSPPSGGN